MKRLTSSLVALGATLGLLAASAHAQNTVSVSWKSQVFVFHSPPTPQDMPKFDVIVSCSITNSSLVADANVNLNNAVSCVVTPGPGTISLTPVNDPFTVTRNSTLQNTSHFLGYSPWFLSAPYTSISKLTSSMMSIPSTKTDSQTSPASY